MNERIKKLVDKTVRGEGWVEPVKTEFNRTDLFLSPVAMSGKRVCEYILNQELLVLEESCFTGLMRFDGSVEGDIFNRVGHKNFQVAMNNFYNKPVDNLLTFEWQHSVGDFGKIINRGLSGIKEEIEISKVTHKGDQSALEFLETQTDLCNAIIGRAKKGSKKAFMKAEKTTNPEYKENLKKLSEALLNVPEKPAESFYEAVLCLYFCYSFIPDSIGLIDRYLYPFYKGNFFGNDDNCSNEVAKRLFASMGEWNNTENYLGKKWLFGNLIGYNEHYKFFGSALMATPDGRYSGDMINYGIGQSQGKDRNGLTALLNSVAKCDSEAVLTGPSVTNVLIDEQLINNNDHFEKLVDMFETYFKNGGTHFQLTYVSKEDLINAKNTPDNYRNLRVRVSGFSDYFVFLNDALQDEIIARTK